MSAILPPLRDETAFLGLGSNLEDRLDYLQRAVDLLDADAKVHVDQVSTVYETEPVGGPEQGPFLNLAVRVRTRRSPRRLLHLCHDVEEALGRVRPGARGRPPHHREARGRPPHHREARGRPPHHRERWGPRTIDIDILLWHGRVVAIQSLQIPHPRLTERAFALVPLVEVAPGMTMPDGTSLATLLARLAPIEGVTAIGTQIRAPR
ncbi:MAG: 2-amino-4-hydroxy-6-hydroxymethyldihydropteridine diphosphokinase [Egibacteraceae bacterium]